MAMDLAKKSSALAGTLHPVVRQSAGDLVRSMNCYYSNLIEGHETLPRDIDKALAGGLSKDPEKRNLQLEAKAHIEVQRMIDRGDAPTVFPAKAFLLWVHRKFCSRLPPALLQVENPGTHGIQKVIPGEWRATEVSVGRHVPPLAENLEYFMNRFEEAYNPDNLSQVQQVIAIAASHHRLVWIHPFLDGNGRVARLYSHAFLLYTGIGSDLWSVSRGLARNVETYKSTLMAADVARKGDLDGRGSLSHEELVNFCRFFPRNLYRSGRVYGEIAGRGPDSHQDGDSRPGRNCRQTPAEGRFPATAGGVLCGRIQTGQSHRNYRLPGTAGARRIIRTTGKRLSYIPNGTRGPVRLGFPPEAVERWLPSLYPAQ